jgi:hypothetical protein
MSKQIIHEQTELENNIVGMADRSRKQLRTGIDVLEKSQQAAAVYITKSATENRKLLGDLFTSLRLDGTQLLVDYNPYSQAISKRVEKHHKVERHFRTNKNTPQ